MRVTWAFAITLLFHSVLISFLFPSLLAGTTPVVKLIICRRYALAIHQLLTINKASYNLGELPASLTAQTSHQMDISGDSSPPDIDLSDEEYARLQIQKALRRLKLQDQSRRKKVCRRKMSSDSSGSQDERSSAVGSKEIILTPLDSTPKTVAADNDTAKEKLDPTLVGMSAGLKHLYSGKEDRKGRFQWQTTIPKDVGAPVEDAETQKWALIVRHVKVLPPPLLSLSSTDPKSRST